MPTQFLQAIVVLVCGNLYAMIYAIARDEHIVTFLTSMLDRENVSYSEALKLLTQPQDSTEGNSSTPTVYSARAQRK